MDVELKETHVGKAIAKRIEELEISKSEFGRRVGIPQQHVNRVLERDTMETKKLAKICRELDMNFFALFCQFPTAINAYLAAVSTSGDANNFIGEASVIAELEIAKNKVSNLMELLKSRESEIAQLKSQLTDKDSIIKLLEERKK